MTENEISYLIRGAIFKVYKSLGPELLESAYVSALAFELRQKNLNMETELMVPLTYGNEFLERGYRIDILVNSKVAIEVKSVERLAEIHHKQLLTYLRLLNLKLGILINFKVKDINAGIIRKVNGL